MKLRKLLDKPLCGSTKGISLHICAREIWISVMHYMFIVIEPRAEMCVKGRMTDAIKNSVNSRDVDTVGTASITERRRAIDQESSVPAGLPDLGKNFVHEHIAS